MKDSFNSYPLGRPAQAGAIASVKDEVYFQATLAQVLELREKLTEGLVLLGFSVPPSSTNFLFARHVSRGGAELAAALREKAVLVRHFAKPRISEYLRITVGTERENARLLQALVEILLI